MLNDLREIERALTWFGIALGESHPNIKEMAKGPALRVRLAADARIASVEIVPQAGGGAVWTLRDGQHNGFPGLKTAAGLLALDDAAQAAHQAEWERSKEPSRRRAELLRLLSDNPLDAARAATWPNAGHRKRIAERLQQLRPLADDPLTAAVPAAFARFLAALDRTPPFLAEVRTTLEERVRDGGDEWLDLARSALTGPIALVIDVTTLEFGRGAGDRRQVEAVSAALSAGGIVEAGSEDTRFPCALSGDAVRLHAGNFPQPNLPGLGQTYLFSRNRDIPSLTRYGRTADASFPVGEALLRRLSGAVSTLTQAERKGKTWRLIPAERGDKPDLLVVSLADPDLSAADAAAEDDEGGEAALEALASRVIDQSKGKVETATAEDQVQILVLRTVDPANRKAIYHRRTRSAEFFEAARSWQKAVRNTPDHLGFPIPIKGERKATVRRPGHVAPLSIVALSRMAFEDRGRRRVEVTGASAADAFQLFLRAPGAERRASDLLRLLVRRHGGLFAGLALALRRGREALGTHDPKADLRRDALRSASWIGALLHHLGRDREIYMSGAGFLLGQVLAAADIVHVGYCLDVRDGGIPPTLLGNSLLATAAERPREALALLCRRWPPYAAWAKNERRVRELIRKEKDDAKTDAATKAAEAKAIALRLALSQARRVGPVAAALQNQLGELDGRTDETFQAELLLGYMAGLPPVEKKPDGPGAEGSPSEIQEASEGEEP